MQGFRIVNKLSRNQEFPEFSEFPENKTVRDWDETVQY